MELEERKNLLKTALTMSFVDNHKDYKSTISLLNKDLKKMKINFKYTYDQFCIELLNQSLDTVENVDIFDADSYEHFFENFWKFNFYNLQCIINKKLDDIGFDRDDFYKKSASFNPKKQKKNV
jgi:ATP-dependent exoDNAse (exonuclease V) beta subunit